MSNLYGWLKKWKRKEDMSSVFDLRIKVKPEHIDVLGHVNNVVYVQWMQDVASAHIETLGVGLDQYLEMKHAMVAVEHHVQYRKAAMLDDDIILRIGHMGENAKIEKITYALNIIDRGLKDLGYKSDKDFVSLFNKYLSE